MLVPDPPILGFRALQAILDLRAAALRQPQSAIRSIAERAPPADRARGANAEALARLIRDQGARLERDADFALLDALQLAASQPEPDPAAFAAATAILLADRLQSGLGRDDLGAYWENFHRRYFDLPAHDRAAIVQGFLTGAMLGRVRLGPPRPKLAQYSASRETVRRDLLTLAGEGRAHLLAAISDTVGVQMAPLVLPELRTLLAGVTQQPLTGDSPLFEPLLALAAMPDHAAHLSATAILLAEAVEARDAEGWFAITLWPEMIDRWLGLEESTARPILAGLRHLYEADPDWVPAPDRMASPQQLGGLPLLPVLDEGFSGGHHGARVG